MNDSEAIAAFHDWVLKRIDLAKRLNEGECGGSYAEAILILSSILSGIAADLWPGKGKDRKRFVQLWSTYTRPELNPNLISVPLLLDSLHTRGEQDLADTVRATRPSKIAYVGMPDMEILTGEQVDQSEAELKNLDSRLSATKLRRFSYGNLFYEHLRSGYTHEYHTTDYASTFPMASKPAPVSYVNFVQPPFRRIYFDISWISELVASVSDSVKPILLQQPLAGPKSWWIEG